MSRGLTWSPCIVYVTASYNQPMRTLAAMSVGLVAVLGLCVIAQSSTPVGSPVAPGQARGASPADGTQGRGAGPGTAGRAAGRGRRTFDPAAIERAKAVFVPNCGFCHGTDARGATQGPDLARSLLVLSDDNGKDITAVLRAGRADKGMPAFPNLTNEQIADLAVFLHERVEAARSQVVTEAAQQIVGNAAAGAAYFNGPGRCGSCHSITGDLKGVGARYDVMTLQDKFVNPRGGAARGQGTPSPRAERTVTVTLASGRNVSGTLTFISEFAVSLVDASGQRLSFTRIGDTPKVEVHDPLQAHFDLLRAYTDADIHNLTAYLVTLK
jgi:cytochrome c oxidase cbb3-type subunit 3